MIRKISDLPVYSRFRFMDGFGPNPWKRGEVWVKIEQIRDRCVIQTTRDGKPIAAVAAPFRDVEVVTNRKVEFFGELPIGAKLIFTDGFQYHWWEAGRLYIKDSSSSCKTPRGTEHWTVFTDTHVEIQNKRHRHRKKCKMGRPSTQASQ